MPFGNKDDKYIIVSRCDKIKSRYPLQDLTARPSNYSDMNVYDFDNTILKGDSTARFFAWCYIRMPSLWPTIPGQICNGVLFLLGRREKQDFKERMLSFLSRIPDVDAVLDDFWQKNFRRVKKFYLEGRRPDDVVISASPEFIIEPACRRLGVKCVMGSPVNKKDGKFMGLNCHGAEKVRRFRREYPDGRIDEFYSDSVSDTPLAELAERAFMVRGDVISDFFKREK